MQTALMEDLFEKQMRECPQDTVVTLLRDHCISLPVVRERMHQSNAKLVKAGGEHYVLSMFASQTATFHYWALAMRGDARHTNLFFNDIAFDYPKKHGLVNNVMITLRRQLRIDEISTPHAYDKLQNFMVRTGYTCCGDTVDLSTFLSHFDIVDQWKYHV